MTYWDDEEVMHRPLAEDYENAKEILDRDGWCQRRFSNGVSFCMGGAISKAIQERLQLYRMPLIDWTAIRIDTELHLDVPSWNDRAERTREEVQDRLMLAAKKLRNEGR